MTTGPTLAEEEAPEAGLSATDSAAENVRFSLLLPLAVAVSVAGLATVAALDAAARDGERTAQLFWIGLAVVLLPPVLRLLGRAAGRGERLALVAWLGLALYVVKALNDPWLVYSDSGSTATTPSRRSRPATCSTAIRRSPSRPPTPGSPGPPPCWPPRPGSRSRRPA